MVFNIKTVAYPYNYWQRNTLLTIKQIANITIYYRYLENTIFNLIYHLNLHGYTLLQLKHICKI